MALKGVLYGVQITRETQEKREFSSSIELLILYYEICHIIEYSRHRVISTRKEFPFISTACVICSPIEEVAIS